MELTEDQVWHATKQVIAEVMRPRKTVHTYTDHDICNGVVKKLFGKSFSAIIAENNEIHQKCNLGHVHVIRPYGWRPQSVAVLELLREMSRPMTTAAIKAKFPVKDQATIAKCPSELLHFGALLKVGVQSGNTLYMLSAKGAAFLDGAGRLPEFVYRNDLALPDVPEAPLRLIGEMRKVDVEGLSVSVPAAV